MPKVKFTDVGLYKKSWEAECPHEVDYDWLYKQVKKYGFVMSRNLAFSDNGTIVAGFRPIGKFEVV